MKVGSVCSGIGAPECAWSGFGWSFEWCSEIEPFPSKVLAYHFPNTPNLGDMTKIHEDKTFIESDISLLVGGTPCQSFSIAGLRKGLDDERGNLALEFCRILLTKQPRWFVWENVPGVLSSNGGKDFGTILQAFSECGYSVAYRILDAQYFGVPQRRRRVFVVGHLGNDWRPPFAVLFERESLRGNTKKSREKGKVIAAPITSSAAQFGNDENAAHGNHLMPFIMAHGQGNAEVVRDGSPSLTCNHEAPIVFNATQITSPTNRSNPQHGGPCHSISKGDANNAVVIFQSKASASQNMNPSDVSPTLDKSKGDGVAVIGYTIHGTPATSIASKSSIAQSLRARVPGGIENSSSTVVMQLGHTKSNGLGVAQTGVAYTLESTQSSGQAIHNSSSVRRLTPLECERLQGFPDNWTNIPKAKDGPRYKAIGNSMAVPVMKWIGSRIKTVDSIIYDVQ